MRYKEMDFTVFTDFEKQLIILNFLTDKVKEHEEDINQINKDVQEIKEEQKKTAEELSEIKKLLEKIAGDRK